MTISATPLRALGYGSLALSVGALVGIPFGLTPTHRPVDSYLFVIAMLAAISGAIITAAKLRQRNDPLAEKAVPSTLVAYLLFALMTARWLAE